MLAFAQVHEETKPTQQSARRENPSLADAINAGYAELARAMVKQALNDALHAKDPYERDNAAFWLGSPDGQDLAEMTGFDTQLINLWLSAGCPSPKRSPGCVGVAINRGKYVK